MVEEKKEMLKIMLEEKAVVKIGSVLKKIDSIPTSKFVGGVDFNGTFIEDFIEKLGKLHSEFYQIIKEYKTDENGYSSLSAEEIGKKFCKKYPEVKEKEIIRSYNNIENIILEFFGRGEI